MTISTVPGSKQASEDAARLLKRVWQPDDATMPLPVDPVSIARRLGIDVYDAVMDQDVYAALVKEQGQDPTILLNAADSQNRKRFSCAHEIGHFLRHPAEEYEFIDYRNMLTSQGTNPEEIYANAFAACLLMPESEVRRLAKAGVPDYEMALIFDVSREAMQFRLMNLGLRNG